MTDTEALHKILQAWTDAGSNPAYHIRFKQRLRSEWPTLADALDLAACER